MGSVAIVPNAEKPHLLDCPFCGADGYYRVELWTDGGDWGYRPPSARVVCAECGCSTDWRFADDSERPLRFAVSVAVDAWNKRARGAAELRSTMERIYRVACDAFNAPGRDLEASMSGALDTIIGAALLALGMEEADNA